MSGKDDENRRKIEGIHPHQRELLRVYLVTFWFGKGLVILKNSIFIIFTCVSIASILFGHVHYKDKLANIATTATAETTVFMTSELAEAESTPELKVSDSKINPYLEDPEDELPTEVDGLLGDWVERIDNTDTDEIRLSFFGSSSLVNEDEQKENWPALVTSDLQSLISNHDITSTVINVGESLSIDIPNSDYVESVIESNPDILLVEAFILNDVNVIQIEDTLSNLEIILTTIENELPETSIILMPANPLVDADYYSKKTKEDLASFAKEKGFDYANHWERWPSIDDTEKLKEYLDNSRPNTAGHELWAKYMVEYLTR